MDASSLKAACAGVKKNDDIYIEFTPGGEGVRIDLRSTVEALYGTRLREVIAQTLLALNIENAAVYAEDFGAMDFAVRARVETAVERAGGERLC